MTARVRPWVYWLSGGVLLVLIGMGGAFYLVVLALAPPPLRTAAVVSPDGAWRAWVQRPRGSMEPMFYTVKLQRRRWFAGDPVCEVAIVENWGVERASRIDWPGAATLRFAYGLADRDKHAYGAPVLRRPRPACAGVHVTLVHDRALDAAASEANDGFNDHYDDPQPPYGRASDVMPDAGDA